METTLDSAVEDRIRTMVARLFEVPAAELSVEPMPAHASARRYVRVRHGRHRRVVVMVLPEDALASEEASDGERPEELPFLSVQRYLDELGLRVPKVHAADLEAGLVVLEDAGDTTLEAALAAHPGDERFRRRLYGRAIDQLAFLRRRAEERPDLAHIAFQRRFDARLFRWELDHFVEWFLEAREGVTLAGEEKETVDAAFDRLARTLAALPAGLTHRDYQSRNLMVKEGEGELVVIDFQDALQGPMVYDLVALLRDSYVVLPREFVDEMLLRYLDGYRALGGRPPEPEDLQYQFDLQTLQRKLKDAGRFEYIHRVKGNDSFLPSIAPSLAYVREALGRLPEYEPLRRVLARHVEALR